MTALVLSMVAGFALGTVLGGARFALAMSIGRL